MAGENRSGEGLPIRYGEANIAGLPGTELVDSRFTSPYVGDDDERIPGLPDHLSGSDGDSSHIIIQEPGPTEMQLTVDMPEEVAGTRLAQHTPSEPMPPQPVEERASAVPPREELPFTLDPRRNGGSPTGVTHPRRRMNAVVREITAGIQSYTAGEPTPSDRHSQITVVRSLVQELGPRPQTGGMDQPSWAHDHERPLRVFGDTLVHNTFHSPIEASTKVSFPPIKVAVDIPVENSYALRMHNRVDATVGEPDVRGTSVERIRRGYQKHHNMLEAQLQADSQWLQNDELHDKLQSTTRTETFEALIEFADLEEGEDFVRQEGTMDVTEDPDNFRFFLTRPGVRKVEKYSDDKLNLVHIGEVIQEVGAELDNPSDRDAVMARKEKAFDALLLVNGNDQSLSTTDTRLQGGMVIGCFYDHSDRRGRHYWEVEARHCTPKLMSSASRRFKAAVRDLYGNVINPFYISPAGNHLDITKFARDSAMAVAVADAVVEASEEVSQVANQMREMVEEARRVQEVAAWRLLERCGFVSTEQSLPEKTQPIEASVEEG